MEITYEFVRERFSYDPEGYLIWGPKVNNDRVGKRSGCIDQQGYWRISLTVNGKPKMFLAHRLIFLWHHGYLPKSVDHINRIRNDNRIENLRDATHAQQMQNRSINSNGTNSGYKGVKMEKDRGTYRAAVKKDGKWHYNGRYKTPEEAHAAYIALATELFGEFASGG